MNMSLLPCHGFVNPPHQTFQWPRTRLLNWCLLMVLSQCTIHTTVREIPLRDNEILTQEGDSIYTIANAYNVDVRELVEKNGLNPAAPLLEANQKLVLPPRKGATISTPVAGPEDMQTNGPEVISEQDAQSGGWTDVGQGTPGQSREGPWGTEEGQGASGLTAKENADGVRPLGSGGAGTATKIAASSGIKEAAGALGSAKANTVRDLGAMGPSGKSAAGTASSSGPLAFAMPVAQAPSQHFSADHTGLTFPTKPGAAVRAAEAGKVIFAGAVDTGDETTIILQHKDAATGKSYLSVYMPVSPKGIKKGAQVARNQVLGHTQASDAGNLYFEIREGSKRTPIDPKKLIKASLR